mmetsp:Transcript_25934/g.54546  ORF Transcript_25934/g.54546 Transcript_25934/m.54546 type:complete len:86 (-) Transcript_25934:119-376(-)
MSTDSLTDRLTNERTNERTNEPTNQPIISEKGNRTELSVSIEPVYVVYISFITVSYDARRHTKTKKSSIQAKENLQFCCRWLYGT